MPMRLDFDPRPFLAIMLMLIALSLLGCAKPRTDKPLGVGSQMSYIEPTAAAAGLWNAAAGCRIFEPGIRVRVDEWRGTVCGGQPVPWPDDASAVTYRCRDGSIDIAIKAPGDLRTQTCIVMHELGHALGLDDSSAGIMQSDECPALLWPSASDRAQVSQRCRERSGD